MSNIKKVLISLMVCILASVSLRAGETSRVDSLLYELESVQTPGDSLAILYNIFDSLGPVKSKPYALQILKIARRNNDSEAQLDMLRNLATIGTVTHDSEFIEELMDMMAQIPDSEDKRQTMVFLRASRATADKFDSDEERDNYTRQLMKTVAEMPENVGPYERVTRLFSLVAVLSEQTGGELLSQYLDNLDIAIKALPQLQNSYLRSYFNNIAAEAYWKNDENNKSIRSDRNQLLHINRLEDFYAKRGRKFRHFDTSRYMCLRRMLQNHEALSETEFNNVVAQMNELIAKDKYLAADYNHYPAAQIGILLHQERYNEALPLIKLLADSAETLYERRFYTRQLIDVAEKAGNADAKRNAEVKNSHLLEEYLNYKTSERVRELQLLYDVNALRRQQITEKFSTERQHNCWLLIGLGVMLMGVILLGALFLAEHRRYRQASRDNLALKDNDDALQLKVRRLTDKLAEARRRESEKTQLMNYISHELSTPLSAIINYSRMISEAVPEKEVADYVNHFTDIIETNTRTIQTITADMQEFALNESKPLSANNVTVNPNEIATIAAETIEPNLDPKIKIKVQPSSGNQLITTDPRRVQLVLLSCIDNMVQSLAAGTVTVHVVVSSASCQFIISAPGSTPGSEPIRIPNYASTLKAVKGDIAYNAEVPALTLTITL